MRTRKLTIVVMIAMVVVGVVLLARGASATRGACPMDDIVIDRPGWHLNRDFSNDCHWTLYNTATGERAEAELYAGLPVSSPPEPPQRLVIPSLILIATGAVGLLLVIVVPRRKKATVAAG